MSSSPAPRVLRNVAANFVGGALSGGISLLSTPILVRSLGLEGYALVGIWQLLQTLLGLLDLGMGATLMRALAVRPVDAKHAADQHTILWTLEVVYGCLGILCALVLAFTSSLVASRLVQMHEMPPSMVALAIRWMAIGLAFNVPSALYASGLIGTQQQGRLSGLTVVVSLFRYLGGSLLMQYSADLVLFFQYQAVVSCAQWSISRWLLWSAMPAGAKALGFRLSVLGTSWQFSAGMAATTVLSAAMANADRLALVSLLPAADLGRYSIAFAGANALQIGIQPFYRAYFPRFAELLHTQAVGEVRALYYQANGLVASFIVPAVILGSIFAPDVMTLWMGHADTVTTDIFRWLLIGVGLAGLGWIPAAFQQAHGWTSLHVGMIAAALLVGFPAMVFAIFRIGVTGAVVLWVVHGFLEVTVGIFLMTRRVLVNEWLWWYRRVIVPPFVISVLAAIALQVALPVTLIPMLRVVLVVAVGSIITGWRIAQTINESRAHRYHLPVISP